MMDKDKFWKIFLRTSSEYRGLLWREDPILIENVAGNAKLQMLHQSSYYEMDKKNSFMPGIAAPLNTIMDSIPDTACFYVSAQIKLHSNAKGKLDWVASLENEGRINFYKIFEIDIFPLYKNHTYKISKIIKVPKPKQRDDFLKIYLWNASGSKISIDSLAMQRIVLR